MRVTIKELAEIAGVSIATVSHVINKTRYVSPELVEKVENAIRETGYFSKKLEIGKKRVASKSIIALIIPNLLESMYLKLIKNISDLLIERGYLVSTYCTQDSEELEHNILMRACEDKNIKGIILIPCKTKEKQYNAIIERNIPLVFLEKNIIGKEEDCVTVDNEYAIYNAVKYLIKSGHEKIGLLLSGEKDLSIIKERINGYKRGLLESDLNFNEDNLLLFSVDEEVSHKIISYYQAKKPSAIIVCNNFLMLDLLKMMNQLNLKCPEDISIIGFGDEEWYELMNPPITSVSQDIKLMSRYAVERIINKIEKQKIIDGKKYIMTNLCVRKSTQMIGRGPFGERAFSVEDITFSKEEKQKIREGNYKVAISFHYGGTAWQMLHEKGIRETLDKFGITVLSVTDAHFDPELQVTQLEGIGMQQPDAIIAIPSDDTITAPIFKKLSLKTKLIFMSNVPKGLDIEDYVTCVSVNERENGSIAATMMGKYFMEKEEVKVGFITHGASFYGTYLRDMVATQIVCENYSNIQIAEVASFVNIEDCYKICKNMIKKHPDIQGLYVCWDQPALQVIKALEEMKRHDIAIFTYDLDEEIAKYLIQGKYVKGMGTQRPYEQGVAVALATAKALIGKGKFKYVGVSPYEVQKDNFLRAWKEIMHEPVPESLLRYFGKNYVNFDKSN